MSSLTKILSHDQLDTLELLLNGAFAPVDSYLNQADHLSVLNNKRLANGCVWPLPITLNLSPAEKLTAQITKRITLVDHEQRAVAELKLEELYRLPPELAAVNAASPDTWYAAGQLEALNKRLHLAFNRSRYTTDRLRNELADKGWKNVVAVQANPSLDAADMKQACEWLKQILEPQSQQGGLLIQLNANEQASDFHQQVRALRASVRCSVVRQIKMSLLPQIAQQLSPESLLLLQALIARNYGATGFVVGLQHSRSALRFVLQYRDELGIDLIPVKHRTARQLAQTPSLALAA